MSDLIKVKATKPGVYADAYRSAGDVFMVEPKFFSSRWMEKDAASPIQEQSQEAKKAQRENAEAAIEALGNALAGNPTAPGDLDAMTDDALRAHYEVVTREKAGNAKRETLIKRLTDRLNAD